jgi:hypothetical protein
MTSGGNVKKVRLRAPNGNVYECEVRAGATVVVGRDADVAIPESSVSRQHFKLQLTGAGEVELADLGSQNGTEVNGRRVTRAALASGDTVVLGKLRLEVEIPGSGKKDTARHLSAKEKSLRADLEALGLAVIARLDGGGALPVYRARRAGLEDEVFVKAVSLREREDGAGDRAERLAREARLAAKVRHRSVVQIYEVREKPGLLAIVMEPVEGRTLAEEIAEKGALPPARALEIAAEIGRALVHAHALGVIHRNLTPASVMLTAEGGVKLLDFGFAKSVAPPPAGAKQKKLTQMGRPFGTVEYAPPEQSRDASAVDFRADIYALGATLYHALSGEPPVITFHPDAPDDAGAYAPQPIGKVAPDLPQPARAVVTRCMRPSREMRYKDAAELVRALEGVLTLLVPPAAVPWKGANTTATSFYGRVQGDDLVEFVQMVEMNRKSGTLEIYGEIEGGAQTVSGTVLFREGRIADARTDHEAGRDAALALFLLRAGSFCAAFGEAPPEGAESLSVSALLMEACRRKDEADAAAGA